jgi:type IV secretory pathway protease TraF
VQRVSGGWNIVINNTPAVNSANKPYLLSDTDSRMLAYYATSYKGVIPPDTYIILGDAVGGSEDSTAFGLVAKSGLVGRVKL